MWPRRRALARRNPVISIAPARSLRSVTRISCREDGAAAWLAVNSSLRSGIEDHPMDGSPFSTSAIDTHQCGKPRR